MKEVFVKKANARFDSKFNYEQFEYVNAKTKSVIVCPVHGPFEQSPDKHLHSIHPCPGCWGERRKEISQGRIPVYKREALSKEDFNELRDFYNYLILDIKTSNKSDYKKQILNKMFINIFDKQRIYSDKVFHDFYS